MMKLLYRLRSGASPLQRQFEDVARIFPLGVMKDDYFASGFGRIWNFTTLDWDLRPNPPSIWLWGTGA